jgi:2-phospho-L-lactate guanylyltransferase (CobY/MobA/RfbA family)
VIRSSVLSIVVAAVCSCSHAHSATSGDKDACSHAADATKALQRFRQDDDVSDLKDMASALTAALKSAQDPDLTHALNVELAAVQQAQLDEAADQHANTAGLIIADGEVGNLCSEVLSSDIMSP